MISLDLMKSSEVRIAGDQPNNLENNITPKVELLVKIMLIKEQL